MTTWGYLILIAALTILAAVMLYARFANRSREKSLHHPPVELMFPYETISVAPVAGVETGSVPLAGLEIPPVDVPEEVTLERLEPADDLPAARDEKATQDSRYFDELQEAAAGLAMLMRSSPVGRSEPVVFAPETETEEPEVFSGENVEIAVDEVVETSVDAVIETSVDELVEITEEVAATEIFEEAIAQEDSALEEEALAPLESELGEIEEDEVSVAEIVVEDEVVQVIVEETVIAEETAEIPVLSREELLGEQVCEKLDRLDEDLNALEALVFTIESSLRALDSDSFENATPPYSEESVEDVSVAA
jgi:hypothetical protein